MQIYKTDLELLHQILYIQFHPQVNNSEFTFFFMNTRIKDTLGFFVPTHLAELKVRQGPRNMIGL